MRLSMRLRMRRFSFLLVLMLTQFLFFMPFAVSGSGIDPQSAGSAPEATLPDEAKTVRPVFKSLSPAAAAELIEQREDLILVDVRTPQERKHFRIADSLLIPVGDVIRGRFMPEAGNPVLVICAVGGRSYVAGKVMTSRGHSEVYNLEGGIESWRKAGLPLETGPENIANQ